MYILPFWKIFINVAGAGGDILVVPVVPVHPVEPVFPVFPVEPVDPHNNMTETLVMAV